MEVYTKNLRINKLRIGSLNFPIFNSLIGTLILNIQSLFKYIFLCFFILNEFFSLVSFLIILYTSATGIQLPFLFYIWEIYYITSNLLYFIDFKIYSTKNTMRVYDTYYSYNSEDWLINYKIKYFINNTIYYSEFSNFASNPKHKIGEKLPIFVYKRNNATWNTEKIPLSSNLPFFLNLITLLFSFLI